MTRDVDFVAGCANKTAYRTIEKAWESLENSIRSGVRAPRGMRLDVFLCPRPERHRMGRVYHVGTTQKRRMRRRQERGER